MSKKISLYCTESTRYSNSLREIAKGLSTRLGYKVLRTLKLSSRRTQVKYGHSINKYLQYMYFYDNNIPHIKFTIDDEEVMYWLEQGHTVFGRKLLNSSCGKGIVVMDKVEDFTECPVYTLYRKKKREFRVHVFRNQVVSVTEKRKKSNWPDQRDTKIRNLTNGYVFCQNVENEPEGLRELALRAAEVSASDFRGVDIGYNEKKDELFVIEVNSAPGIVGSNINKYLEVIANEVH